MFLMFFIHNSMFGIAASCVDYFDVPGILLFLSEFLVIRLNKQWQIPLRLRSTTHTAIKISILGSAWKQPAMWNSQLVAARCQALIAR